MHSTSATSLLQGSRFGGSLERERIGNRFEGSIYFGTDECGKFVMSSRFLLLPTVLDLRLLFRKLLMVGPYLLSLLDAGIALQGLITQVYICILSIAASGTDTKRPARTQRVPSASRHPPALSLRALCSQIGSKRSPTETCLSIGTGSAFK